jgi:hypothetical protein
MADLAVEMQRLGRLSRRLVSPEPREIRYKVIMPFRRALDGICGSEEIEALVETVPGVGLRLNAVRSACVVQPA